MIHCCLRMQKLDVKRLGEMPILAIPTNPSSPLSFLVLSPSPDIPSQLQDLFFVTIKLKAKLPNTKFENTNWKHKSKSRSLKQEWGREKSLMKEWFTMPKGLKLFLYLCERVHGCWEPQNPNWPSDNGTNYALAFHGFWPYDSSHQSIATPTSNLLQRLTGLFSCLFATFFRNPSLRHNLLAQSNLLSCCHTFLTRHPLLRRAITTRKWVYNWQKCDTKMSKVTK